MGKKKIVVLHSGGLDSTVCLHMAVSRGHEAVSLGVNYNQHHHVELDRVIPMNRSVEEIKAGVSVAFLPGRNGIFLMLASAEAAGIGAQEVWTGINSVDFSGYPDCRAEFVDSFQKMLNFAIPKGPRLVAPLQNKSKRQIAKMAERLGINETDTWSCYRPAITATGLSPCGSCDACKLHEFAWRG
jgi:7-cyano-7-deazaguanine synthase